MNEARLTDREYQIARLYAEGYVGKEISDIIHASYRTVVNHTQNIYDKTGIPRCTNAIASWWLCHEFNITFALAPAARKVGAAIMLALFMATMTSIDDDYMRFRRGRMRSEREEYEYIIELEQTEA